MERLGLDTHAHEAGLDLLLLEEARKARPLRRRHLRGLVDGDAHPCGSRVSRSIVYLR
jgi:hypothetical protein